MAVIVELVGPWDSTQHPYSLTLGRYLNAEWKRGNLYVKDERGWSKVAWLSMAGAICTNWQVWGEARHARMKHMEERSFLFAYRRLVIHRINLGTDVFTPEMARLEVPPDSPLAELGLPLGGVLGWRWLALDKRDPRCEGHRLLPLQRKLGTYESPCPYCAGPMECDLVDNGVGMAQCGPFHCERCGASEIGLEMEDANPPQFDEDEKRTGFYRGGRVSPYANTVQGTLVDHETAKRLYEMGLLDKKPGQ